METTHEEEMKANELNRASVLPSVEVWGFTPGSG
jgi:hypothetical protein